MGIPRSHHDEMDTAQQMLPLYKTVEMKRLSRNVFLVVGTTKSKLRIKTSRNMIVLRHNHQLSLVNAIRLEPSGAEALEKLGPIRHVIRLGLTPEGLEADRYYRDTYGAEVMVPGESSFYPVSIVDQRLTDDALLPIPRSRVFVFRNTAEPEAALLVDHLLITSESLQDQKHNHNVSKSVRTAMKLGGLHETSVVIPPRWRKLMHHPKLRIEDDFTRLLRWDFNQLVGASGAFVPIHAKEETVRAVDASYPVM